MSQKQKKKAKGQQSADKNPPISAPPYYNYEPPVGGPEGLKGVGPVPPQPPNPLAQASPLQNGGNESPQHHHQQSLKAGYPPDVAPSPGGHLGPPQPSHHPQHHPQSPMHHHQQPGMHRPPGMGDKDVGKSGSPPQHQQPGPPPPGGHGPHPSMMPGHSGGYGGMEMPPHGHHQPGMHGGMGGPPPPPQHMGQQQQGGGGADGMPKEDPNAAYQGHPMPASSQYPRYHDPNMMMGHHPDPYAHHYRPMGGKPAAAGHMPGRGPPLPPQHQQQQRYMGGGPPPPSGPQQQQQQQAPNGIPGAGGPPPPQQQQQQQGPPHQGPTPTLNSLLQSHPQPGQMPPQQQHRSYPPQPNAYDQQQQMPPHPHSQQQQQPGPPPPPSPYGPPQTGWVPPPRPYSPQMGGPQQPYRPNNSSRGQSPYSPPSGGQNPGPYPQQQQQGPPGPPPSGGQPPTQQQPQGGGPGASGPAPPVSGQYSAYPQRYPTPPGGPSNHRSPYPPPHQYSEAVRGWTGPSSGHSPAPSPGPQGGHPQSPLLHPPQSPGGTGHAPSPSPQPAQSPHPESTGQNSNDSSNGVHNAGGTTPSTPNPQQAMRPTPSPTGSSGSRSMSPAVGGQQPPRPASNHSQVGGGSNPVAANPGAPTNQYPGGSGQAPPPPQQQQGSGGDSPSSRSQQQQLPMHPGQGSYQQQQQPPPQHMQQQQQGGYKMGPNGAGMQSPYPPAAQSPQQQQYQQQGNYPARSPYPAYGQPPANMPPGGGYPNSGRPMQQQPQPPHGQYPPYQQQQGSWTAPQSPVSVGKPGQQPPVAGQSPGPPPVNNATGPPLPPQQQQQGHPQQPGGQQGPPPGSPGQGGPMSQRQLNYLKQHLQHKVGSPTPPPPQQQQPLQGGYGNGPGMHPPMGPPHHMGPPPPNGPTNMGPPTTPQSGVPPFSGPHGAGSHPESIEGVGPQDNGLSSSGSNSGSGGGHGNHPVTALVTTGPDGSMIDEASQQSTLSNASAASTDDPQCATPKSRKNDPSFNQSHLASATASPSGHGGPHEDFEIGSPNWNRTPASPGFTSHSAPQETYRPSSTKQKSDSLCKLYEMDDNPDRKGWLDGLLGFMEEKRTPITACPTISKQPLDLFRLYLLVKERAGYIEVTKSKTWKEIAGTLGIGASSSAAYTLRKHYSKFILGFECQYDRGGADPAIVMQQAEAGTKKKSAKNTSVPSPVSVAGSSNSQDSFPAPPGASNPSSMDGYNNYPGGYPPTAGTEYNAAPNMPRPPSQTNSQNPHPGNAPSTSGGDNISVSNPFDDPVGPPPRVPYQQSTPFPPVTRPQGLPYPNQPGYSQYGAPEQYPPGQYPPPGGHQGQFPPPNRTMYPPYDAENSNSAPSANDPYRGAYGAAPGGYPQNRPYPQQAQPVVPPAAGGAPQGHQAIPPQPAGPPGAYAGAPQQDYYRPDQNAQPRRHPDFEKQAQPYPPYQQRPGLYGWQNNGQYRGSYPPPQGPQQWPGGQRPPQPGGQPPNWDRYAQQGQQSPYPGGQQNPSHWGPIGHSGAGPGGPQIPGSPSNVMRGPPQQHPGQPQQRNKQPMPMMPQQQQAAGGGGKPGMPSGPFMAQGSVPAKRDIVFPLDSVEATLPVYYRRKRIAKNDIGPVDPWRIFMALRSGLLVESTWALDVINILLFDDSSIQYFGLAHLPGLLNLLLDHFQRSLADMFESNERDTKTLMDVVKDKRGGEGKQHSTRRAIMPATEENDEDAELNGQEENVKQDSKESDKKLQAALVDLGCVTEMPDPAQRSVMFKSTTNYTMTSRKGIPVKFNLASCEEDLFVTDDKRDWDIQCDRDAMLRSTTGGDPWTYGHTDMHPHDFLMGCFRAEMVNIPFARFIKGKDENGNDTTIEAEEEEVKSDKSKETTTQEETQVSLVGAIIVKEEPSEATITSPSSNATTRKGKNSTGRPHKKRSISPLPEKQTAIEVKQEPMEVEASESSAAARLNGPSTEAETTATKKAANITTNGDDETEQEMEIDEDDNDSSETDKNLFNLTDSVRDPARVMKRRRMSDYEDECYTRDEASLYLVNESQDCLARRCVGISNILRNLSFVPGNELEFANSSTFLSVLGKLLLLHHTHPVRAQKTRNYDREEDVDFTDSCSSLAPETEWWWDYLVQIRENMLVAAANISGYMELSRYDEVISRPVLDGLLHWAVCPSAHGQDPFPTCGAHSQLSPQRLALEALCKLCVTDANVDLVIATPPFSRLEKLCAVLTRHLCRNEEQVLREFSVNLLHYLVAADSAMARTVAMQSPCISYLVAFIEQAEQTALGVANQNGINYLRDNPDSMGTSLDMLRRAAGTLLHLSRHPDNRPLFVQQEQRLLALVMSHILDQQVALIISRVLFQVSRGTGPMLSAGVKTIESFATASSNQKGSSGGFSSRNLSAVLNKTVASLSEAAAAAAATASTESEPSKEADNDAKKVSPSAAAAAEVTQPEDGGKTELIGMEVSRGAGGNGKEGAVFAETNAIREGTVNNIDKVLASSKPPLVVDGGDSNADGMSRLGGGEGDAKSGALEPTAAPVVNNSSSGEVCNATGTSSSSCGKQQMPTTNSTTGQGNSGQGSPPQQQQQQQGGSQMLTSPIVSISS